MGYEKGFTITNKNSGTMGIYGNRICISIVNRIWRGLVNTALRFTDGSRRFALLRCQIDNIKGPLKVHGLCLDMQSISSSVVQFWGSSLLESSLDMQTLKSLPPVCSIASFEAAQALVLDALSKNGLCQLKSRAKNFQHNREWTFLNHHLTFRSLKKHWGCNWSNGDLTVICICLPSKMYENAVI